MLEILKPTVNHYEQWDRLMKSYFDFYKFNASKAHLLDIFEKIQSGQIHSLMALDGTVAVGLANYIFNHSTFYNLECYLSDLYVDVKYRGHKTAPLLMDKVFEHAKSVKCGNVNWLTATDNMIAQKLYDKVARKPNFIMYQRDL